LHGLRYDKLKSEELDYLCTNLSAAKESGDTVLILYAEATELKIDNPKRPPEHFKELCKYSVPVEFDRQSPAKLVAWAVKHFVHEGIRADNAECMTLVEYCNRDMSALSNEITKLCAYLNAHGRDRLTRDDIYYICCKIDEIAAFDFANAILNGDKGRAYAILKDMTAKKQKPPQILGSIASVYSDLYRIQTLTEAGMNSAEIAKAMRMSGDYKVKLYQRALRGKSADFVGRALRACEEADMKLKSTQVPSFGVLASLVISP
ncbi:MAG: DNA polymerase III subunit delta, partial [Clostridia bacterium]|nr:DNA polymerase III subunit delta [Clostridia bacterium]